MNANPNTVMIPVNTRLWGKGRGRGVTPLTKKCFRLEVIGLNLTDIIWPEQNKCLASFEAFFTEFNSAYLLILFIIILGRHSLPVT